MKATSRHKKKVSIASENGGGVTNPGRRSFFKMLAIGGGAFVVFKVFNFGFDFFSKEGKSQDVTLNGDREYLFESFRVVDDKNQLSVLNRKNGEEILIIEK